MHPGAHLKQELPSLISWNPGLHTSQDNLLEHDLQPTKHVTKALFTTKTPKDLEVSVVDVFAAKVDIY